MRIIFKKAAFFSFLGLVCGTILFVLFSVFFDEVLFVRKNTIYHVDTPRKIVALTFDDGPSPEWTPRILEVLKQSQSKATFFLLGKHVQAYPGIARLIIKQGCEIGNHTFNHQVILNLDHDRIREEIKDAEKAIKDATGVTPVFFRPPKGWVTDKDKKIIKQLGYDTILWTLNSKDWVTFDDKYIVRFLLKRIRPGDIILFHDSGGVFGTEGGNREETVKAVRSVVEKLKERGYIVTTVGELLASRRP
jgi:peptidoglycan-N-acetylglucosamine deacetylase